MTLIISPSFDLHTLARPLESGGNSIASLIALKWTESGDFGQSALDRGRPRAVRDDARRQRARVDDREPFPLRRRDGNMRRRTHERDRPHRRPPGIVRDRVPRRRDQPRALRTSWDSGNVLATGAAAAVVARVHLGGLRAAHPALGPARLPRRRGGRRSSLMSFLVAWQRRGALAARDHLARTLVVSAALLVLIPLIAIMVGVVAKGYHSLRLHFLTQDQSTVGPLDSATAGRRVARHRRHARTGGYRDADLGAARFRDGGVPERDRRAVVAPGAHARRRDERHPLDRRRSVHLRGADPERLHRAERTRRGAARSPS